MNLGMFFRDRGVASCTECLNPHNSNILRGPFRLADFTISCLDADEQVIDSIFNEGTIGHSKTFSIDSVTMRFVKIENGGFNCLSLGEVEIWASV